MKVKLLVISTIAMALFAVAVIGASARNGDPHEQGAMSRFSSAIPRPPILTPCIRHKLMALRALRNSNINVRWVLAHCRPIPRERKLLLSVLRMNNASIRNLQLALRMEHLPPPVKRPPIK